MSEDQLKNLKSSLFVKNSWWELSSPEIHNFTSNEAQCKGVISGCLGIIQGVYKFFEALELDSAAWHQVYAFFSSLKYYEEIEQKANEKVNKL